MHALDDFWHRKYTEDDEGRLQRIPVSDEERAAAEQRAAVAVANAGSIHLPSPSFYPIIVAFALPVIAYGMIYKAFVVSVVGGLILLGGLYAWALEPSAEPADHHDDEHGDGGSIEGEHAREDATLVAAAPSAGALGTGESTTETTEA